MHNLPLGSITLSSCAYWQPHRIMSTPQSGFLLPYSRTQIQFLYLQIRQTESQANIIRRSGGPTEFTANQALYQDESTEVPWGLSG